MKKLIVILLTLMSIAADGQTWKMHFQQTGVNTKFGTAIPVGTMVLYTDSNTLYRITRLMAATDSMATVYRGNYYTKLNGASGGGDSYWYESGAFLKNSDTTKTLYLLSGNASYYTRELLGPTLYSLYSRSRYGNSFGQVSVSNAGSVTLTGNSSKKSDVVWILGNSGQFNGTSQYNTNNRMNLGGQYTPWGKIWADSAQFTGIVRAYGGTSTNWNTAYGWGNHATAGYIVNPLTTYGDMMYGNPSIEGGLSVLPIGSDGQVLKSVTTNPHGTPITTPTWASIVESQWVTNGSKIYYNTGNVGIGTTNPANAKLEITAGAGVVPIRGTSTNVNASTFSI